MELLHTPSVPANAAPKSGDEFSPVVNPPNTGVSHEQKDEAVFEHSDCAQGSQDDSSRTVRESRGLVPFHPLRKDGLSKTPGARSFSEPEILNAIETLCAIECALAGVRFIALADGEVRMVYFATPCSVTLCIAIRELSAQEIRRRVKEIDGAFFMWGVSL